MIIDQTKFDGQGQIFIVCTFGGNGNRHFFLAHCTSNYGELEGLEKGTIIKFSVSEVLSVLHSEFRGVWRSVQVWIVIERYR